MHFDFDSGEFRDTSVRPDALAVIAHDRSLSWQALAAEAAAWCGQARALGLAAGAPIVVRGHKEAAFMVALAGAPMLKAPFVPVDAVYPAERLRSIIATLDAHLMFDAATGRFEVLRPGPAPELAEKDLGYIMFTSGTTGQPKGVQIGREGVRGLIDWMRLDFDLGPAPVFLNHTVFSFDVSLYDVFGMLALGGSILMLDRARAAASQEVSALIARHRATTWVSTPSFAQQQLINPAFSQTALPSLRTFLFCGEPLPVPLARQLRKRFPGVPILNTYGPTEATVATTLLRVDDALLATDAVMPIGHAKRDSLVFSDGGELCIVGPHVMRGYINRPDLNATRMFVRDGQRGFRTGDLGTEADGGMLFCQGRIDDQIKLNGYRLELLEVDAALATLPGVRAGAAVALRRPNGTVARLVAFVETGDEGPGLPAELEGWKDLLAARLPHYMLPTELLPCARLPVSVNYKIDRAKLAEIYQALNA
ncbi:AMP-binding protein [Paracidovorax cattleyae]|uniref:D-alanine--poly(Phosphoribitol) ligase subunit 1 n=1 Tax=Paracidovorax cattleyae TaxID=80868 RepID=A0A1H0VSM4_9BURK|nr:AMP-binding protein [Paracidovorax cattleyae]SDP81517.1 D-alanine--poly(phosphoribitol) ligase subunit 1 [Paracidovorax cattleyae]